MVLNLNFICRSKGVKWGHLGSIRKSKIRKLQNQKIKFRQFIIHVQSDFWRLVMKIIILADVAKIISRKISQKLLRFVLRNSDFRKQNFQRRRIFRIFNKCSWFCRWYNVRSFEVETGQVLKVKWTELSPS